MIRRVQWLGLLGLVGVGGLLLGSGQLACFLAFFLLPLVGLIRSGDDFERYFGAAVRWTLILSIFAFTTVFFFSALVAKVPMVVEQMQFDVLLLIMIQGLSWSFAVTLVGFVMATFIAAVRSARSTRERRPR